MYFLADRTATQYDRLLAAACCPVVRPSVCDAVHCGSQGWCTRLKVVPYNVIVRFLCDGPQPQHSFPV